MKRAVGKTRSWKVISGKVRHEIGKNKVGKFGLKLESLGRSWKVTVEVGKFSIKLESIIEVAKSSEIDKIIWEITLPPSKVKNTIM